MMSLPVLENAARNSGLTSAATTSRGRIDALRREVAEVVPEIGVYRPAFLLRCGYAPPPSGRVGRRIEPVQR